MFASKPLNAVLAVVLWPVVLVLYQLFLFVFQRLYGPKDWIANLIWVIIGIFFISQEFNLYVQGEYLGVLIVHIIWGVYSYGMLVGIEKFIARRRTGPDPRPFMYGS